MRRVALVMLIGVLLVGVVLPAGAQGGEKRIYITEDDLFMFEYPAEWEVLRLPLSIRLLGTDGNASEDIFLRVDLVYPGTRGLREGEYAGLSPSDVLEEFRTILSGFYDFAPATTEDLLNKEVAYTTTDGDQIMLMAMDLGRNNIGLLLAYTEGESVFTYIDLLLEIGRTSLYFGNEAEAQDRAPTELRIVPAGPDVVPFIIDPDTGEIIDPSTVAPPATDEAESGEDETSTEGTEEAAPAEIATETPSTSPDSDANAPTEDEESFGVNPDTVPVAFYNDIATSSITLIYGDGTLAVVNTGNTPVDLGGLELVAPDGQYFDAADFTYVMRRVFVPGNCLYIHAADQPAAMPAYCNPTGSRSVQYLYRDGESRAFVWNQAVSSNETFGVLRDGELVARCMLRDGACTLELPLSFFALEIEE